MSNCSNCGCNACNNCNSCNSCNSCGSWWLQNGWNNWNQWNCWNQWNNWWQSRITNRSGCQDFIQPIVTSAAQFSNAGVTDGATLVIHKIVLEPCGNQSCTPRTFSIRITGPSYPCGEIFQLRAGSCTELDEPLVITGLEPGTYCIEEVFACPNAYITTITGPVCGRHVTVGQSWFPTVVTIVNRRRLCRLCHSSGCGCGCSSSSV